MIQQGKFRARPTVWGPTKTAKGDPQFAIEFELLEGDDQGKHITWFGGLKGGGFEYTSKAMLACGWDGETPPNQAELTNEVFVTIEHEEYPEGSGEFRAKAKYVNALDDDGASGALINKYRMDDAEAAAFGREFLARFKTSGIAAKKSGTATVPAGQSAGRPAAQPAAQAAAQRQPPTRQAAAPRNGRGAAAPPPQDDPGLPPEPPDGAAFDF
jgi:hypothetical protein